MVHVAQKLDVDDHLANTGEGGGKELPVVTKRSPPARPVPQGGCSADAQIAVGPHERSWKTRAALA